MSDVPESGLVPNISLFGQQLVEGKLRSSLISTFGWALFDEIPSVIQTGYCLRNEERIIQQYKSKPHLIGLLCALTEPFQDLEFVYGDLYSKRWIDTSEGAQLDGAGSVVGLSRQGLNDDEYRLAIKLQAILLMSNGEWETLISSTKFLTGASIVKIYPDFPAGVIIFTNGAILPANILQLIEQVAMGGVKISLIVSFGETTYFAYQKEDGPPESERLGYDEPGMPSIGGPYMEKII